jgi:hypothetical protein
MQITDLTEREQSAIDYAWARDNAHNDPPATATSNEWLVNRVSADVEALAKEADEAEFRKAHQDFQTLPPEKQDEILADIETAKQAELAKSVK